MSDVTARRAAQPAVNLGLEWQHRENPVDISAHFLRAPAPPNPYRRRYIVDDGDRRIAGANAPRHAMREIRAVDDDQDVRLFFQHGLGRFANPPQDQRQSLGDRHETYDRQFLDRNQCRKPLLRHVAAADTNQLDRRSKPFAQRDHQSRT